MFYLALAILSSTMITLLMHVSEKYSKNSISMLATNYLMCLLLSFLFTGTPNLFPAVDGVPLAMGMGVINGILFLGGFVLLQWNISKNGVVLPATFMKLGVLVPTILAIAVFGESPRLTQIIGILAAIAAILVINGGGKQEATSTLGLILLLLGGGSGDAMSKIYEEVGPAALKDHFLLYTFAVALILCILLCILRRQSIAPADILFGLAIGIPNYFSARFLLLSLENVPAVVAYPSYSVGTIVMVALGGVIFFREKLSRRKLAALGIILAALVLLNL